LPELKKIGFIGATGMLGLPVIQEMVKRNFEVVALCRDIIRAKMVLPPQVRIELGDLKNISSIENFIQGLDAVYLNLSVKKDESEKDFLTEREGLQNFIQVAQNHKLKRIFFISSLVMNYQDMNSFHWWVFDVKRSAVNKIKQSGIPYTLFYPSAFMENFFVNQKSGNKILLAGKSKHKLFFISSEDYANMVCESLLILDNKSKEYPIQGLKGYTMDEAANIIIDNYKLEKLKPSRAPLFILKFLGFFKKEFFYLAKIIEALNEYPEKFISETTWKELGKPQITLKEFTKKLSP
jgi:putative NADH-flavin reductase